MRPWPSLSSLSSLPAELSMPTELRHVYRSLLRAATYLPESNARTYVRGVIKKRFRDTSDKINYQIRRGIDPQPLLDRYHTREYIAGLRRKANKLERAGLGDGEALEDVLMRTYGRNGARRRQLLAQFMAPEDSAIPQDTEGLKDIILSLQKNAKLDQQQYGKGSMFRALKSSQELMHATTKKSRRMGKLDNVYTIPKENMWGRPTPLKVQANLKRRLFAEILDRMHPPLPVQEWNRLRDLSVGVLPREQPPKKRVRTGSNRFEGDENSRRLLEYFTTPVEVYKPSHNPIDITSTGISARHAPQALVDPRTVHSITPRYMRRLYARIWHITPKMALNESQDWEVTWGSLAPFYERVAAPGWGEEELFEGIGDAVLEGKKKNKKRNRGQPKGVTAMDKILAMDRPKQRRPEEDGYLLGVVPNLSKEGR